MSSSCWIIYHAFPTVPGTADEIFSFVFVTGVYVWDTACYVCMLRAVLAQLSPVLQCNTGLILHYSLSLRAICWWEAAAVVRCTHHKTRRLEKLRIDLFFHLLCGNQKVLMEGRGGRGKGKGQIFVLAREH